MLDLFGERARLRRQLEQLKTDYQQLNDMYVDSCQTLLAAEKRLDAIRNYLGDRSHLRHVYRPAIANLLTYGRHPRPARQTTGHDASRDNE